jgi:hypothetical protein
MAINERSEKTPYIETINVVRASAPYAISIIVVLFNPTMNSDVNQLDVGSIKEVHQASPMR